MPKFNLKPAWQSCKAIGRPIGVDRKNNIIHGYVVAQEGPFKSNGRGEFDAKSLASIIELMAANQGGTRSRFTHPDMSNDGLGKFLGRVHNPALSTAIDARTGKQVQAVRADLHFDATALETPPSGGRPLGEYVMALAESDPGALSSSIVVKTDEEYRRESDGSLSLGEDGQPLPPLWRPKDIRASDIVDTGDAVDSMLSAETIDGLPLAALWRGSELLDSVFAGQSRDVIEERLKGWLGRYLTGRFGEPLPSEAIDPRRDVSMLRRRLRLREIEKSS